jgi:hypothetical protein
LAGALLAGALAPATGAGAAAVSTNWAGYVATRHGAQRSFSGVSGVWTVPTVTCTPGREAFSAVWVGLGGYGEGARSLEQAGTDANCPRSGRAWYAAWYELLPAAPVTARLTVRAGDQLVTIVRVNGRRVTFGIRDLTTGRAFQQRVRASAVDVSSAEWIVEAPSVCPSEDSCRTLALANFGQATFAHATATADHRIAPVSGPAWSAAALELQQREPTIGTSGSAGPAKPSAVEVLAVPSALTAATGAFSVGFQERPLNSELPPAPTLPGGP